MLSSRSQIKGTRVTEAIAVEARGVDFGYDRRLVLESVDLEIRESSFVAVIGPNGGGKSTLLFLLLGLQDPQRGELKIFGRSPAEARNQVGYMPQGLAFDSSFPITVEEVVELGALGQGRSWGPLPAAIRESARAAMDRVGCVQWSRLPFASLSGGQKQLVLIARAMVGRPRLLLLDEPTANLDPTVQDLFFRVLSELRHETTVLLVSHDIGFVSEWCDTVLCVNQSVVTHSATEVDARTLATTFGADTLHVVHHHHDH
jgi:zinc transport system ATP-binding protein